MTGRADREWESRVDESANELVREAIGQDCPNEEQIAVPRAGQDEQVAAKAARDAINDIRDRVAAGEEVDGEDWDRMLELELLAQLRSTRQSVRSAALKSLIAMRAKKKAAEPEEKDRGPATAGEARARLRSLGKQDVG